MSTQLHPPSILAKRYQNACLSELQALKPGNVHVFADGHGMSIDDFITSADVTTEIVADSNLKLGQRIYEAVKATRDKVGQNTNLGMLLLCVPILEAAMRLRHGQTFEQSLNATLENLTLEDAQYAAQAIALAAPAGLGEVKRGDVHQQPTITLLEMMKLAQFRDRIAWNYANQFSDIVWFGVNRYRDALLRWDNPAWSATAVYLGFLSGQPDTHVVRKHGEKIARAVMHEAAEWELLYWDADNPKLLQKKLLDWDAALKSRGLNPGTSADLVVATLLVDQIVA